MNYTFNIFKLQSPYKNLIFKTKSIQCNQSYVTATVSNMDT